jgi:rubrerythrin
MLDGTKEEKEHVGEFQTILLRIDKELVEKMKDER